MSIAFQSKMDIPAPTEPLPSDSSVLLLMEAVTQNNNTDQLEQILASYSVSTQSDALREACKENRVDLVESIIKLHPHLAWRKNEQGSTAMHISAFHGHCGIVEILVALTPALCYLDDNDSKIPLHIAAENGRIEVLKALIKASPGSVKWRACLGRNALHLAVMNGRFECFRVLMGELVNTNQEGVLDDEDNHSNTVLQIATSRNEIQILKLLQDYYASTCPLAEINSRNGKGLTYLNDSGGRDNLRIHDPLVNARATETGSYHSKYYSMEPEESKGMVLETVSLTTKSVYLAVLILFASGSYGSLSYFQTIYPPPQHQLADMTLFKLNALPRGFYYITINAVTFTVSMLMILVLMWSLRTPWTLYFRLVGIFLMTASSITFGLMVHELVPRFSLMAFGSHKISSFEAVWLFDFGLILLVSALGIFIKLILAIFKSTSVP